MSKPTCNRCERVLEVGETAYAEDWKVIDTSSTTASVRLETRYICEDCNAKPHYGITVLSPDKYGADRWLCITCRVPFPCEASKGATT